MVTGLFLRVSALSSLLGLLLGVTAHSASVKTIAKPYVGEYECQTARLGDTDCLQYFDFIRLELTTKGTFHVRYKTRTGTRGENSGDYRYADDERTVTFIEENASAPQRAFPIDRGTLTVCLPVGERMLYVRFQRK